MSDTNYRSLVKAISWRIVGSASTITISYLVTGSLSFASVIGLSQITLNTLLYWMHERVWNRIGWGKDK